jgi:hypothetical protein
VTLLISSQLWSRRAGSLGEGDCTLEEGLPAVEVGLDRLRVDCLLGIF